MAWPKIGSGDPIPRALLRPERGFLDDIRTGAPFARGTRSSKSGASILPIFERPLFTNGCILGIGVIKDMNASTAPDVLHYLTRFKPRQDM
jgi:hypothetical protein